MAEPPYRWHSRGYLPHFNQAGIKQHVTVHLADSLPETALRRMELEINHLPSEQQKTARRVRLERLLDAGYGSCILRQPECARVVELALLFGDGTRYRLLAWVVMPNHVHLLLEEMHGWPVGKVMQSWKRHTTRELRGLVGGRRSGPIWQRDSWDRFIRDADHLAATRRYIEENPAKAGLCNQARDWPFGSARFG